MIGSKMPFDKIYPPSIGSANSVCYGIGECFGNVATPTYIVLELSGIQKGVLWAAPDGEPPNGIIKLTQELPTRWRFNDGFLDVYWDWRATLTYCWGSQNSKGLFSSSLFDTCLLTLDNQVITPNSYFYLGKAEIIKYF